MGKTRIRIRRLWVQAAAALAQNAYLPGFFNGKIYKGRSKQLCVPGLNCYSCPGAVASCPVGALQAVLSGWTHKVSLYVSGLLLLFGMVAGRWICGWLCPFGLFQELLHKLSPKRVKIPQRLVWLRYVKYVILVLFVILLPMFAVNYAGQGDPWFCKYICPSGTIFGALPLIAVNENLRSALGLLFSWKLLLAVAIVVASVFIYRFFCRFLCPLGAIYALLNRLSLYRMRLNHSACTHCGACKAVCKMEVDPARAPNSPECIRCGDCVSVCPHRALHLGFDLGDEQIRRENHQSPSN